MKKYALFSAVLLLMPRLAHADVPPTLTAADTNLSLNNVQNGISGDGLTIFGRDVGNGLLPAFWSATGGLTDIAMPNGYNFVSGYVNGATPDASILIGRMNDNSGIGGHAFSYQSGNVTILPSVAGAGAPDDQPFGISSDGSTIVGYSRFSITAIYGVKWVNGASPINQSGTLHATVAGIGMTSAATSAPTWGEFGAQLGLAVTDRLSATAGLIGTSGDSNMGAQLHGIIGLVYKL